MSSYQWQSGTVGVWSDIVGATGTSYLVADTDSGGYIRVCETVSGVSANSAAVGPVTAAAPSGAYFTETFAGGAPDNGFWQGQMYAVQAMAGTGSGYGVRLTSPANLSQGLNHGQFFVDCASNRPHFGFITGSNGAGALGTGSGFLEEVWWRYKIRIPTPTSNSNTDTAWQVGFTTTGGFHVDDRTASELLTWGGSTPKVYSNDPGIQVDGVSAGGAPTNPRWRIHIYGGPLSSCDAPGNTNTTWVDAPGAAFLLDTWQTFTLHYKLGSQASDSPLTEWWIDGTKIYPSGTGSVVAIGNRNATGTQPQVYYEDNAGMPTPGRLSYGENRVFSAYRSGTTIYPYDFYVDYGDIVWGPTLASVGG